MINLKINLKDGDIYLENNKILYFLDIYQILISLIGEEYKINNNNNSINLNNVIFFNEIVSLKIFFKNDIISNINIRWKKLDFYRTNDWDILFNEKFLNGEFSNLNKLVLNITKNRNFTINSIGDLKEYVWNYSWGHICTTLITNGHEPIIDFKIEFIRQ